jgi:hypothetical protein
MDIRGVMSMKFEESWDILIHVNTIKQTHFTRALCFLFIGCYPDHPTHRYGASTMTSGTPQRYPAFVPQHESQSEHDLLGQTTPDE